MKDHEHYEGRYRDLRQSNDNLKLELKTLKRLYRDQLVKTAILQIEIDNLHGLCHFYKTVEKNHRIMFGAK